MSQDVVKKRWPRGRSARRTLFGNPWFLMAGFAVLVLLVILAIRYGRRALEIASVTMVVVPILVVVAAPVMNRAKARRILDLQRERLRVIQGFSTSGASEAELAQAEESVRGRRVAAQTRINADLGAYRGLLTVAKLNPLAWKLCLIAWILFCTRGGIGLNRTIPLLSEASFGVAAVLVAIAYLTTRSERGVLREAIPKSLCPDCGYPLSEVLPRFSGPGAGLGPERCTECGAPWPLIPPEGLGPVDSSRPDLAQLADSRASASEPQVPPRT